MNPYVNNNNFNSHTMNSNVNVGRQIIDSNPQRNNNQFNQFSNMNYQGFPKSYNNIPQYNNHMYYNNNNNFTSNYHYNYGQSYSNGANIGIINTNQRNDYLHGRLGYNNNNTYNTYNMNYMQRDFRNEQSQFRADNNNSQKNVNNYGMPEEKEKEKEQYKNIGNNSYRTLNFSSPSPTPPSSQYSQTNKQTNNISKPSNTTTPYKSKIKYPENVTEITHNKRGLHNIGNTCYMNTCLQNLIHSTPFIHKLLTTYPHIKGNKPITTKFHSLCLSQTKTISFPKDFLSAFSKNHFTYTGYPQHDTQEFCRLLLEDISDELNVSTNKNYYKEIKTKGKTKQQIKTEFDTVFRKRENSIIIDTFYSQFITSFQCLNSTKCEYIDYSCQNMLDIPLRFPITRSTSTSTPTYNRMYSLNTSYSLYALLDEFFEEEVIDFELKCDKCKQKTKHKKTTRISQLPEILILSLQRFSHDYTTINRAQIAFENELDLSKYIDNDDNNNTQRTPTLYKLYGISNHTGSFNFGHYYAYIKIKDEWFEFNDNHVYHHTMNYNSTTAYILFYQRIDTI